MLRNRKVLFFSIGTIAITVVTALVCQFTGLPPVVVCIGGCLCVGGLCLAYTIRRYRSIAQLNAYIQRLSHGKKSLDIRDNAEGELSILKNEIYKVTAALTEQAASLSRDKRGLANALTDISHQLKTPLTAIGVMADLLDDDELPRKRGRNLLRIYGSASAAWNGLP